MFGVEFDYGASRLGFVRRQAGESVVAPIRKIYDSGRVNSIPRGLVGRLQNVQPIAIEQKSVIPEQFVQLRNYRMIVGLFLSIGFFVLQRQGCGSRVACPSTSEVGQRWSMFLVADPRWRIFGRTAAR